MAPLPKRKLNRLRGRQRHQGQFTQKKTGISLQTCTNCKKLTRAHMACIYCGYYKNRKTRAN